MSNGAVQGEHAEADEAREYVFDMIEQLSTLARDAGEHALADALSLILKEMKPSARGRTH